MDGVLSQLTEERIFKQISSLLSSTKDNEVKIRCVRTLANFMANGTLEPQKTHLTSLETAQHYFASEGGISVLFAAYKSEKDEEIKIKLMTALFHMTMFNG